jgi:hypothetical protein
MGDELTRKEQQRRRKKVYVLFLSFFPTRAFLTLSTYFSLSFDSYLQIHFFLRLFINLLFKGSLDVGYYFLVLVIYFLKVHRTLVIISWYW